MTPLSAHGQQSDNSKILSSSTKVDTHFCKKRKLAKNQTYMYTHKTQRHSVNRSKLQAVSIWNQASMWAFVYKSNIWTFAAALSYTLWQNISDICSNSFTVLGTEVKIAIPDLTEPFKSSVVVFLFRLSWTGFSSVESIFPHRRQCLAVQLANSTQSRVYTERV